MEAILLFLFAIPALVLTVHEHWLHPAHCYFLPACLLAVIAVFSALMLLFFRGY